MKEALLNTIAIIGTEANYAELQARLDSMNPATRCIDCGSKAQPGLDRAAMMRAFLESRAPKPDAFLLPDATELSPDELDAIREAGTTNALVVALQPAHIARPPIDPTLSHLIWASSIDELVSNTKHAVELTSIDDALPGDIVVSYLKAHQTFAEAREAVRLDRRWRIDHGIPTLSEVLSQPTVSRVHPPTKRHGTLLVHVDTEGTLAVHFDGKLVGTCPQPWNDAKYIEADNALRYMEDATAESYVAAETEACIALGALILSDPNSTPTCLASELEARLEALPEGEYLLLALRIEHKDLAQMPWAAAGWRSPSNAVISFGRDPRLAVVHMPEHNNRPSVAVSSDGQTNLLAVWSDGMRATQQTLDSIFQGFQRQSDQFRFNSTHTSRFQTPSQRHELIQYFAHGQIVAGEINWGDERLDPTSLLERFDNPSNSLIILLVCAGDCLHAKVSADGDGNWTLGHRLIRSSAPAALWSHGVIPLATAGVLVASVYFALGMGEPIEAWLQYVRAAIREWDLAQLTADDTRRGNCLNWYRPSLFLQQPNAVASLGISPFVNAEWADIDMSQFLITRAFLAEPKARLQMMLHSAGLPHQDPYNGLIQAAAQGRLLTPKGSAQ